MTPPTPARPPRPLPAGVALRDLDLESDYAAVRALWEAEPYIHVSEKDSPERLATFLARNPGLSSVAEAGGAPVAVALAGEDGRYAILSRVAVAPAWRGRGVGEAVVRRCLAGLRARGIDTVFIFVYRGNPATAFWARLGFEPFENAFTMALDL